MIGVTSAEEAAPPFGGLEKHSVPSRVWRAIGHAVLHDMNVNPGAQRLLDALPLSAVDDFLHGEIRLVGLLPMEQRRRDPNFVRDLYFRGSGGRRGHLEPLLSVPTFNTL
jgi:hypothetical protein